MRQKKDITGQTFGYLKAIRCTDKKYRGSSYEEVKEDYDEMIDEFDAAEFDMFPNGRDYDAENLDD